MKIELDTIYNEDCLEGMKRIDDESIDAIICDLPYGVLNDGNPDAQWDKMLPMDELWAQYRRIAKQNAPIVLFAQGMFTAQLLVSQPKLWRYNLVWDKVRTTGFLNARKQPLRCHEDICVFCKSAPTYNPQMTKCLPHQRNHSRGKQQGEQTNRCYGLLNKPEDIISDEKYPRSIIEFSKNIATDGKLHPTQKPVGLIRYLIRTYTNSGGGSSRQLHRLRHDSRSLREGEEALYRLRAQQGVFRQSSGACRPRTSSANARLRPLTSQRACPSVR